MFSFSRNGRPVARISSAVLVIEGRPELVLTWGTPREIEVGWNDGSVYRAQSEIGNVQVSYEPPTQP